MSSSVVPIYDLIGLGFGPANLAIAGALVEEWGQPESFEHVADKALPRNVLFIEKHTEFRWHPGMLLPHARMQISFLKDLATLRSPQSPLTFLAYLHSQDRLIAFINRGTFTPTRKEYSDYLSWAAQYVQERGVQVQYGEEVITIREAAEDSLEIVSRRLDTGEEIVRRARNLVLSPGGSAKLPTAISVIAPHPRIIHSSTYVSSVDQLLPSITHSSSPRPLRVAVIGSGQSASEVLLNLHNRLNQLDAGANAKHQLDMIFRNGSLKPSDDSPFANEIFDPSSTDMLFNLPSQRMRDRVLREYENTNYGVVNPRTIDALYEVMYDQKVDEAVARRTNRDNVRVHISMRPYTTICSAQEASNLLACNDKEIKHSSSTDDPAGIHLTLQNILDNTLSEKTYDLVVCGTGYDRTSWVRLLASSDIGKHFGLQPSTPVELAPHRENRESDVEKITFRIINEADEAEGRWTTPSLSSSEASTPPTSPGLSLSTSQILSRPSSTNLFITRKYRLLPVRASGTDGGKGFLPRIYLQGCTEATHGLSESLLSILAVRAGLVVEDMRSP